MVVITNYYSCILIQLILISHIIWPTYYYYFYFCCCCISGSFFLCHFLLWYVIIPLPWTLPWGRESEISGNWEAITDWSSQVASSAGKFCHLMRPWNTRVKSLVMVLVYKTCSRAKTTSSSCIVGKSTNGVVFSPNFFNIETWKTGWIMEPGGSCSL